MSIVLSCEICFKNCYTEWKMTILKYFSYVLFFSSKPLITLGLSFLSAQYLFFCLSFVHYHFIQNGFLNPVFTPNCILSSALFLLCYLPNGLYNHFFLFLHSWIIAASVYLLWLSSYLPYTPKFLLYTYSCKIFISVL